MGLITVEEGLAVLEQILPQRRLNKVQEIVFRSSWVGQSYDEIAKAFGYDYGYIKDSGSKLWQLLSEVLGEKVTKLNIKGVLQRYVSCKDAIYRVSRIQNLNYKNSPMAKSIKNLIQERLLQVLTELPPPQQEKVLKFALSLRQQEIIQIWDAISNEEGAALKAEFANEDLALAEGLS